MSFLTQETEWAAHKRQKRTKGEFILRTGISRESEFCREKDRLQMEISSAYSCKNKEAFVEISIHKGTK